MNYIGSKQRLAPWIVENVRNALGGKPLSDSVVADVFAGTGQVGRAFKPLVKRVIANDLERYAYVLNRHYIGNTAVMEFPVLNGAPVCGPFLRNFTEESEPPRKYYTRENAMLIDGLRLEIETLRADGAVSDDQYFWLLTSLVESADAVANTASVYGAFLKAFKRTALRPLAFGPASHVITGQENEVFHEDANALVRRISGDVLYMDPPYNARQYGANYHVLNRLVEGEDEAHQNVSQKVTGLGDYERSAYCRKREAEEAMEDIVAAADFGLVAISYNNEGIIPEERFRAILEDHGDYRVVRKEYQRFKADSARVAAAEKTFEFLHLLRKS